MLALTCIYCGSANFSHAYQRADGRAIASCQDCGLLFIPDIPDNLEELYGASYFHKQEESADGHGYANYSQLSPIDFRWQLSLLRLFAGHNPQDSRRLLDLGCATGPFLRMAGSAGFLAEGVEISKSAAATARKQGFTVLESSFESAQPTACDVVTAWDFIEHVVDLRATFQKVRSTLRDGGVFLFATPDGGSPRAQEHGDKWICLNNSFEHITYLTRPFLAQALREAFGSEPLLLSFDVGLHWTSIIGMVRVGGLTEEDQRLGQLLADHNQQHSDQEITQYGSELGFFYATFLQLGSLSRLIDRATGILPSDEISALRGALLYQSDYCAESAPWLSQGLSAEPLCSGWLATAQVRVTALQAQEYEAQLTQIRRTAEDRLSRLRNESNHLREVNEQILQSVTWKIGRKITEPIEQVPHSRALLQGIKELRERGPVRSLAAARQYVAGITASTGSHSPIASTGRKLAAATHRVTDYVSEHVVTILPAALRDKLPLPRGPQIEHAAPPAVMVSSERNQSPAKPTAAKSPTPQPVRIADELSLLRDPALLRHQALPLVSVILPVYNQTDLLRSSVLSVLSQSYPHLELIIVDDGSREDVPAVLEGLLDLPSVLLFRQSNQKLPRALTNAFQLAKGELLTWTSADNLMHPHAIARLAESLLRHPEAVLSYADVEVIDDAGHPLRDDSYRPLNVDSRTPEIIRLYRSDRPLSTEQDNYINACFLYRRSAADALGSVYTDSLRGAEDYDFWLRLRTCGRLLHIGNDEPLYSYRVHQRSMSHDLITKELTAHHTRLSLLLDLDQQRQSFARQRWEVAVDRALPHRTRSELQELLTQLPVQIVLQGIAGATGSRKSLALLAPDTAPPQTQSFQLFARVYPDRYELVCRPPESASTPESIPQPERVITFPKGTSVSPLALKARDVKRHPPALPAKVGNRPVFAVHLPLTRLIGPIERLRQIVAANPWAFFVFLNAGQDGCIELQQLCSELPNLAVLGEHELGEPYTIYGAVDWLLVPPCDPPLSPSEHLDQLALSYSTRLPLVLCQSTAPVVAPYQLCLGDEGGVSLTFAQQFHRDMMHREVLNSYLEEWQPERCFANLLRHANTFAQDFAVPLPDTGIVPPPYAEPQPVQTLSLVSEPLKTVMLVDSLDVGGLEEVVAFLVRNLHHHGIHPAVACLQRGGHVADKLRSEGHPIFVADGSESRLLAQLQQLGPQVVNSHYASLPALAAAEKLGRPIVETIHNTYVWLDSAQWKVETERSRRFAKALAVSGLVKRYYHAHNATLPEDRVIVVGNAIDPDRIIPVPRSEARRALGIPEEATLFLCLGRYCPQKNQLGIIHGFAKLAAHDPDAILLCMGNAPKEEQGYLKQLEALRASLPCRDRIRIDNYHPDVSTVLSAADAMVMDSFFEGWSLAATEALLTGTPLIHSLCGSAEELCGPKAERGFVIPNPGGDIMKLQIGELVDIASRAEQPNQSELVSAMLRVASERDRLRSDRDAISAYARRVFHPTAILSRYAQTFRTLTRN